MTQRARPGGQVPARTDTHPCVIFQETIVAASECACANLFFRIIVDVLGECFDIVGFGLGGKRPMNTFVRNSVSCLVCGCIFLAAAPALAVVS
jgi:hypothetical protein